MANLKASIKDIRKTKRRTVYNNRLRVRIKKALKTFNTYITSQDFKKAQAVLPKLTKILDKASNKKVLKRKTSSRKISKLTKKLNTLKTAKNVKNTKKST